MSLQSALSAKMSSSATSDEMDSNTNPSDHQDPSPSPSCAHCNKTETSPDPDSAPGLKPCNACKSVLYCSRDCKKADTKKHKKICASLAQEYFKSADVKMAKRGAGSSKGEGHMGGLQKWQFDT
ncbi:hypothetical protein EJ03DRAFT_372090 [Teratosphaeria nubilosa]|uniref:MYND-type domain-containing protein n=1 Tax=Teratosphaeria nubilosa TaxID=161662 RepID=A0A6G1LIE2_9PEZI|nr:hypothetical protein EJ03DRAFT_372090 [Teratosphaeria nubilosa]